ATGGAPSLVYWGHPPGHPPSPPLARGGEGGFRADDRLEINTRFAQGITAADLNGDGRPELIVSCHRSDATYNVPSYVYWNRAPGEFSEHDRTGLPTLGALGSCVADVDHNGQPDVMFFNSV